jgi:hypothetical protein
MHFFKNYYDYYYYYYYYYYTNYLKGNWYGIIFTRR